MTRPKARKRADEQKNPKIFSPGEIGVQKNPPNPRAGEQLRATAGRRRGVKFFFISGPKELERLIGDFHESLPQTLK